MAILIHYASSRSVRCCVTFDFPTAVAVWCNEKMCGSYVAFYSVDEIRRIFATTNGPTLLDEVTST